MEFNFFLPLLQSKRRNVYQIQYKASSILTALCGCVADLVNNNAYIPLLILILDACPFLPSAFPLSRNVAFPSAAIRCVYVQIK